jgi:dTDP-4-amino-4,6-dideoxygalactose transaminase
MLLMTVRFLSLQPQQDLIGNEIASVFQETYARANYILGEQVSAFEKHFAAYCQTQACIGVGNGFDALFIALKVLNLREADEVIVPANTYAATWLAVRNVRAKIVPVEPDRDTFNLDPIAVQSKLTERTRVIVPVHLYGQPCDMTRLSEISEKNNIRLVEDNAQAHGARWKDRVTGSWGVINATSFYPTKNLGALGDGGAITTSDLKLAETCRAIRNYGSTSKNIFDIEGVNSRLDEIQAAVLSVKLKFLDRWNGQRRRIAELYNEGLTNVQALQIPHCPRDAWHVYHLYVVKAERRDELRQYLAAEGIETMIHYPTPPHLQKAYESLGFKKGDFPITEKLAANALSLPIWPGMTEDETTYVIEKVMAFYR